MKLKNYLFLVLLSLHVFVGLAQVSLTEGAPVATINFSNSTAPSVGSTPASSFKGLGFSPNPTVSGRLNSNAWSVQGFDFGTLNFGGTQTLDDYARGSVISAVISPGIYAYTDTPASVANPALMIQPGATDFNPGTITLKIKNNGTTNITQLVVSYNLFVRNDQNSSSSFNFSHSPDDLAYEAEPTMDYTSPDLVDGSSWTSVDIAPSREITITGINILPNDFYYLRWSSEDVIVVDERDEFGLDDIVISASYGAPAPEIRVQSLGGYTILSNDTTPTAIETTEFSNAASAISTVGATRNKSYVIQNIGGAVLNVSNITISGTHAADFTLVFLSGSVTGNYDPVGQSTSSRQFSVTFDPSVAGLHKARITITNSDANEGSYWFDIQGYGRIPQPDINVKGNTGGTANITSANMIASASNNTLWADQPVGSSVMKDFRIQNTSADVIPPLTLTGTPIVAVSGINPGDFVVTLQPSSASVFGGGSTLFNITFTPSAPGIRSAVISIQNNDVINNPLTLTDESPYTFLVQGSGVSSEIDLTGNAQPIVNGSTIPTLVNHTVFDYLNVTGATLDRTYTITNTGTLALTTGALTISGANAGDFSIVTSPAASVAAGGTTTFTLRFDPSATGVRNATVSLVNSDFNENPYVFDIRGYGLDYVPCAFSAVETIARQDFETAPATPIWTFSGSSYTLASDVAYAVSGDGGLTPGFLGGRSLKVNNQTSAITFSAVNTMQFSDIELTLALSSMSVNATDGADNTDRVVVAISTDGGLTWSNELQVLGNSQAKWGFTSGSGTATSNYDGNNVVTSYPVAAAGYLTAQGLSTLRITSLPKSANLALRITLNNNANEIWAIDNVSLFGRRELSTTWNGSSWSNGVPVQNVKAIIAGAYSTASGNIESCQCEVTSGGTLLVTSGGFINIESELNNAGSIQIESGGSLVQRNDFAVNSGNIVVKRNTTNLRRYDYTYWSSPVAGQTLFDVSPLTLSDKYFEFNTATDSWLNLPSSNVMTPGKGYIIRAPQTYSITVPTPYTAEFNGVANNGIVQIPVTQAIGNWNLLGNPYASAIDADAFLQLPENDAVLGGTLYFWTHNTAPTTGSYVMNDYAVYNLLGGTGTIAAPNTGVNLTIPTGKIASGQGFFALATADGLATFNNGMRLTGNNLSFFRTASAPITASESAEQIEKHRLWIDISDTNGSFQQILVGYAQNATNGLDRNFDGPILDSGDGLSFYSLAADQQLTIQGRALPFQETDQVNLGYSSDSSATYSIRIENGDGLFQTQTVFLEDKLYNVIHNLSQSPYEFSTNEGTFDARFVLRYSAQALDISDVSEAQSLILTAANGRIGLKSSSLNIQKVTVIDLLGRNLQTASDLSTREIYLDLETRAKQPLIIKAEMENGAIISRQIVF